MTNRISATNAAGPSVRRRRAAVGGNAAVEFALVVPLLLMAIMGVAEFGRAWWLQLTLQYAVEEAGRYAMTHVAATTAELTAVVQENAAGVAPGEVAVNVTPEVAGSVDFVTITASHEFGFLTLLSVFGDAPITLTGRSRVPLG